MLQSFVSLVPPIMLGFKLTKSPTGEPTWESLDGQLAAFSQSRAHQAVDPAKSSPGRTLTLQDLYPPPSPPSLSALPTQQAHTTAYRELHHRIRQAGLYTPPSFMAGYGADCARYLFLFATFLYGWSKGKEMDVGWGRTATLVGAAVALGLFWQ